MSTSGVYIVDRPGFDGTPTAQVYDGQVAVSSTFGGPCYVLQARVWSLLHGRGWPSVRKEGQL